MDTARMVSAALAVGFALALPAAANAQATTTTLTTGKNGAQKRTFARSPINVQTCNPTQNNYVATGFTPAFYPGYAGGYWGWPSVYGGAYYQYPVQGNPTLNIDYHNATDIVMKDIEFGLVARGVMLAEVRDVGTFSPGAEIKHQFGLSPNVFPIHTGLPQCVPLKITFSDGTKWTNPHLPALRASIYHQ